jgi:hypothetical protein
MMNVSRGVVGAIIASWGLWNTTCCGAESQAEGSPAGVVTPGMDPMQTVFVQAVDEARKTSERYPFLWLFRPAAEDFLRGQGSEKSDTLAAFLETQAKVDDYIQSGLAVVCLTKLGTDYSTDALWRLTSSRSERNRRRAVLAIGFAPRPVARALLERLVKERRDQVAVELLPSVGDENSLKFLQGFSKEAATRIDPRSIDQFVAAQANAAANLQWLLGASEKDRAAWSAQLLAFRQTVDDLPNHHVESENYRIAAQTLSHANIVFTSEFLSRPLRAKPIDSDALLASAIAGEQNISALVPQLASFAREENNSIPLHSLSQLRPEGLRALEALIEPGNEQLNLKAAAYLQERGDMQAHAFLSKLKGDERYTEAERKAFAEAARGFPAK